MSADRITLQLWEPVQAHKAIAQAWAMAKSLLLAGHRLVLEIRPQTRSDAQNRLLHARLHDVSKQCEWAGAPRDVDSNVRSRPPAIALTVFLLLKMQHG